MWNGYESIPPLGDLSYQDFNYINQILYGQPLTHSLPNSYQLATASPHATQVWATSQMSSGFPAYNQQIYPSPPTAPLETVAQSTHQWPLTNSQEETTDRNPKKCECPNCQVGGINTNKKSDEKIHICRYPKCGKVYKKTSHLRAHIRAHTGERPFVCKFCNKKFIRNDELLRHTRIHTGERRYLCKVENCGKRFTRSDHLKKHSAVHEKSTGPKRSTGKPEQQPQSQEEYEQPPPIQHIQHQIPVPELAVNHTDRQLDMNEQIQPQVFDVLSYLTMEQRQMIDAVEPVLVSDPGFWIQQITDETSYITNL